MNEAQFKQEEELIKARIRQHKIRGMRHEERIAEIESTTKSVGIESALLKLDTAHIGVSIEREKLNQKRLQLVAENIKTQIEGIKANMENDKLITAGREQQIQKSLLQLKIDNLELGLSEARTALLQRKSQLFLEGKINAKS